MSKKNIIVLTVTILAVAGFYFYLYRDSFRKAHIQIAHTIRPRGWSRRRTAVADTDLANVIIFRLEHEYKLTSIKVIPVPDLETNKYAHPIWELASDSNSIPTQAFTYGMRIRGMHTPVKGAQAPSLEPNVAYRLFVAAGSLKGEHDFTVTENSGLAQ